MDKITEELDLKWTDALRCRTKHESCITVDKMELKTEQDFSEHSALN